MNETFADVAAITGDKRYLKLAHQFSHRYPPLAEISVSPLLLYYKQARISTFYGMEKAAVLPLLSYY